MIELARPHRCAITPLGAPPIRIARVSARVSTPGQARSGHCCAATPSNRWVAAEAGRLGHVLAHDAAERERVGRLNILGVGADITDMRKGEGDDLAGVGRIGHHLLITGHRGVEADLADRLALRAEAAPPDRRSVRPAPARRWLRQAQQRVVASAMMRAGTPEVDAAMSLSARAARPGLATPGVNSTASERPAPAKARPFLDGRGRK